MAEITPSYYAWGGRDGWEAICVGIAQGEDPPPEGLDLGNPEADDCTGSGITALGEQEYGERKQSKVQLNGHWRYQIEYIPTN